MSFLCVPNQDRQGLLLVIALPLEKVFIAKQSGHKVSVTQSLQINLNQIFSSLLTSE